MQLLNLKKIPHDLTSMIGQTSSTRASAVASSATETNTQVIAESQGIAEQSFVLVSATAPPVSTTKGCRKKQENDDGRPEPHFKRGKVGKRRKCSKCGKYGTGHNASTCDRAKLQQENPVVKRPRGRPVGTGKKATEKETW